MDSTIRILFSGDVSATGVYRSQVANNCEIFDSALLKLFSQHDFTVVNLEGPATSASAIERPDLNIVSPTEAIEYLVSRGITVFNCANNHICDAGLSGFTETINLIESLGGLCFGAGIDFAHAAAPLYLTKGELTAALIGVCNYNQSKASQSKYGTFHDSCASDVERVVRQAREHADYVILNYHAGEEYTTFPMPRRRRLMKRYAEMGIDLIVGHHSHVMQGHEHHADCEIFYSLGNFVFDVPIFKTRHFTDRSALLSVTLNREGLKFDLFPTKCDWETGRVLTGEPGFLDHIRSLSDFSDYHTKWREDAYRTVYERIEKGDAECQVLSPSLRRHQKSLWRKLLHPKWYLNQVTYLRNDNYRPVLLAAYREALLRLFRRT